MWCVSAVGVLGSGPRMIGTMTEGPIDFLGEDRHVDVGETEFGGGPGLVQGRDHVPSSSEVRGMAVRANPVYETTLVDGREVTQVVADSPGVDPVTGREVTDEMLVTASEDTPPVIAPPPMESPG